MLLGELIDRLDKSESNEDVIDVYDLQLMLRSVFGIEIDLNTEATNTRVKCYWLYKWHDSGSWCGERIYFLDNELLAYSIREGRKCYQKYTFANKEVKLAFKEYILSFTIIDMDDDDDTYIDLTEEHSDDYDYNIR